MMVYKFNTMFRGQAVVISYGYADLSETEIEYAIVGNENPYFIHPNYEIFDEKLDRFNLEVYELAKNHIKKVVRNV